MKFRTLILAIFLFLVLGGSNRCVLQSDHDDDVSSRQQQPTQQQAP